MQIDVEMWLDRGHASADGYKRIAPFMKYARSGGYFKRPQEHPCFAPHTRVLLSDGKTRKRIDQVCIGEQLLSPIIFEQSNVHLPCDSLWFHSLCV